MFSGGYMTKAGIVSSTRYMHALGAAAAPANSGDTQVRFGAFGKPMNGAARQARQTMNVFGGPPDTPGTEPRAVVP